MKLTVLGKYGPYPKAGGACSSYLVEDGATLLLDLGSGTLSRLLTLKNIEEVDAIFISHLHFDHTADLLSLIYLLEEKGLSLPVYTEKSDSEWYKLLFDRPEFNIINVDENSTVNIKNLSLSFYRMKHTASDLAVKIKGSKTLLYTGDTLYNDNVIPAFVGCDLVVADCSKVPGFAGPHMTAEQAVALREKTGVRILSSHLGADYSPEEIYFGIEGLSVAEEMKTYEV